jgi:8-amino-7-oxononanoate synthase
MWSKELADQGFLVPAIRPPSVPANRARLRISLTANLDESVVAALALALKSIAGRGL